LSRRPLYDQGSRSTTIPVDIKAKRDFMLKDERQVVKKESNSENRPAGGLSSRFLGSDTNDMIDLPNPQTCGFWRR